MGIKKTKLKTNQWKFPCKGISKTDNTVISFSSYGTGTVLDIGQSYYKLYYVSNTWNMDNFQPIEEEKQPIEDTELTQEVDWDKIELPVWVENKDKEILQINLIDKYEIHYYTVEKGGITHAIRGFSSTISRDEWLNNLKILPKNTEVRISI